jgi:hypothetical protein
VSKRHFYKQKCICCGAEDYFTDEWPLPPITCCGLTMDVVEISEVQYHFLKELKNAYPRI